MRACAIVGDSDSGKTLLGEEIVRRLREVGRRTTYVKHTPHGFDPGKATSDTARLTTAGAARCFVIDPAGRLRDAGSGEAVPPEQALALGSGTDLLLFEGFNDGALPKVRVRRRTSEPRPASGPILCEVVSDVHGFDDQQVVQAFDAVRGLFGDHRDPDVRIVADGRPVLVHGYAARAVAATIQGLCSSLKGIDVQPTCLSVAIQWPQAGETGSDPTVG